MNFNRPRSQFVKTHFIDKCSMGNVNISLDHVVFLERHVFAQNGEMKSFEEITQHECSNIIDEKAVVLFVCHRWQENNKPDDRENIQFQVIQLFLNSSEGQDVTHIWIDYSCIIQDKRTDSLYFQQRDNIQLAVLLSDKVLVLPRLQKETEFTDTFLFTDYNELTLRGWCAFEAIVALYAQAEIYVAYVFSPCCLVTECYTHFEQVGNGLPPCSEIFSDQYNAMEESIAARSYNSAAISASQYFQDLHEMVAQNWCRGADLTDAALKGLSIGKVTDAKRLAFQAIVLGDEPSGEGFGKLLQNFTVEADRAIVANLLASAAGFCCTRYTNMKPRSPGEIKKLATQACFDLQTKTCTLTLSGKDLCCEDIRNIISEADGLLPVDQDELVFSLSLENNPLGSRIGTVFLSFNPNLRLLSRLVGLTLDRCSIGDKGLVDLVQFLNNTARSASMPLAALRLAWNNLGDESVVLLGSCKAVNELNLGHNTIGAAGAHALASNSTITSLSIHSNVIRAEGVRALASSSTLTFLNLESSDVGSVGARSLASNSSIKTLNLRCNRVRLEGVQLFASNSCITDLNLANNTVGNEGAQAFAKNQTLTSLNLCGTGIGADGAVALSKNSKITTLDLSLNSVGDKGARALAANSTLTVLNLQSNRINCDPARAFSRNTTITELNLSMNYLGNEGARFLRQNQTLTSLSLANNGINADGAAMLSEMQNLRSLDLEGNCVGDTGAELFAKHPNLLSLNLQDNNVREKGIQALAANTSLTNLKFKDSTQNVSAEGVAALLKEKGAASSSVQLAPTLPSKKSLPAWAKARGPRPKAAGIFPISCSASTTPSPPTSRRSSINFKNNVRFNEIVDVIDELSSFWGISSMPLQPVSPIAVNGETVDVSDEFPSFCEISPVPLQPASPIPINGELECFAPNNKLEIRPRMDTLGKVCASEFDFDLQSPTNMKAEPFVKCVESAKPDMKSHCCSMM